MGRIILVLCLLISSVVSAQPGYTNINARYKWIAGGFDSSLILPRYGGVPSGLRSAWNTDGQLAVDTANNHLYVYSGGAWVRIANYSDVGSTYTFPYSVVAPGSAIQLENDTTANPANYFYGRNSAGRRGWYPQSGITGVNLYNSNGTLTGDRTINGNDFGVNFFNTDTVKITRDDDNGGTLALYNGSYPYTILTADGNADPALIFTNYGVISSASILTITSATSDVRIPVPSTTSTVGKKVILGDTTQNGRLYTIDPALIGGGTPSLTQYRLAIGDGSNLLSTNAAITGSRALVSDANGVPTHSSVTNTELGYVSGVTSAIQTQLDAKANTTSTYNNQTGTSYTLLSSDNGKIVTLSNAGAITLNVPASLPAGFNCTLVQLGAGQVTITPSSTTVNNRQSFTKIKGQYAAATIIMYATNIFLTQGDME